MKPKVLCHCPMPSALEESSLSARLGEVPTPPLIILSPKSTFISNKSHLKIYLEDLLWHVNSRK